MVIYEGSKEEKDKLDVHYLQWLHLKGIGLRYMSVARDIPSSLAFAVAKNSATLKCLHVNYGVDNGTHLEAAGGTLSCASNVSRPGLLIQALCIPLPDSG